MTASTAGNLSRFEMHVETSLLAKVVLPDGRLRTATRLWV
jgi:hypothetical protein